MARELMAGFKGEGNAVVVCKLEAPRRVEQDNGADGCLDSWALFSPAAVDNHSRLVVFFPHTKLELVIS